MVIFFVGPDGTGKTELSTALAELLYIPRFKVNTEKFNWENNSFKKSLHFDALLPQLMNSLRYETNGYKLLSFISDRGYPCEWVYSQVFGRETDFELIEKIDAEWAGLEGVIIFCQRRSYLDVRADELVPRDKLIEIHNKYDEFKKVTKCRTVEIYVDDFMNADGVTFNLNKQLDFIYSTLLKKF